MKLKNNIVYIIVGLFIAILFYSIKVNIDKFKISVVSKSDIEALSVSPDDLNTLVIPDSDTAVFYKKNNFINFSITVTIVATQGIITYLAPVIGTTIGALETGMQLGLALVGEEIPIGKPYKCCEPGSGRCRPFDSEKNPALCAAEKKFLYIGIN